MWSPLIDEENVLSSRRTASASLNEATWKNVPVPGPMMSWPAFITGHSDWRTSAQASYGCAVIQSRSGPDSSWVSALIPDTVVRFRPPRSRSPEREPIPDRGRQGEGEELEEGEAGEVPRPRDRREARADRCGRPLRHPDRHEGVPEGLTGPCSTPVVATEMSPISNAPLLHRRI